MNIPIEVICSIMFGIGICLLMFSKDENVFADLVGFFLIVSSFIWAIII